MSTIKKLVAVLYVGIVIIWGAFGLTICLGYEEFEPSIHLGYAFSLLLFISFGLWLFKKRPDA